MTNNANDATPSGIPWSLLQRLGDGGLSPDELEAVTSFFAAEPIAPPDWSMTRATAVAHQTLPQAPQREGLLSRVASMLFDSRGRMPSLALRRVAALRRRLIFSAGNFSLHLELREHQQQRTAVSGQIVAQGEPAPFPIELWEEGAPQPVFVVSTNEFGYFSFPPVVAGRYSLLVRVGDGSITVPAFSL